ncbi:MAG TPA: aminopeptidase, partial [Candidatus Nitrosotenuis sp.]|nr:aminopeptidase [Candidatus Nitrosotenuis sp.]
MQDPREKQLAELLTRHSMRVRPGDRVLIEASSTPESMVVALIEAVTAAGGLAAVDLKEAPVMRALMSCGTAEQVEARMRLLGQIELERMEKMEAYVALRGSLNVSELADVPPDKMRLYEQHWLKPVHLERRVRHTRWVVLRWPTPSMAQMAGMSTQAFEDFYFKVCLADYEAMEQAVKPLQEL